MFTAGFDIGTSFVKVCVAENGTIAGSAIRRMVSDPGRVIEECYREAVAAANTSSWRIRRTAATGHGSSLARRAKKLVPEQLCIAAAIGLLDSSIRTIIDIGGLFMRVVEIAPNGKITDNRTKHTCASGSGRLLEIAAEAISVDLESFSEFAGRSLQPQTVTSSCAVFAESEIISQFNAGVPPEDIAAGVVESVSTRAATLLGESPLQGRLLLIGGVAAIGAVRSCLEKKTGQPVVSPVCDSRLVSALGAAVLAANR